MRDDERMRCRCYGVDRRTRCERDATEEDGYCNVCRCPHGSCGDHWREGDWNPTLFFDDPMKFMEGLEVAFGRSTACMIATGKGASR